jgi:hypothetical protein
MSKARLPDDDTADSYHGDTTLGTCPNCGRVAYVPVDSYYGGPEKRSKGHCTGCDRQVMWQT